jgi:hypothetical protein
MKKLVYQKKSQTLDEKLGAASVWKIQESGREKNTYSSKSSCIVI